MLKGRSNKPEPIDNGAEATGYQSSPTSPTSLKTPTITAELAPPKPRQGSRSSALTGTTALPSPSPRQVPLTISHRGTRHTHPENSLPAFLSALSFSNTTALETDIHLTSDSHVLLSHDPTLRRCFGVDKKVKDCTLEYVKTLRTLKDPNVDCATLTELLSLLVEKQNVERGVWALLDIKVSAGSPQEVITALQRTISEFGGGVEGGYGLDYWKSRIKLGIWGYSYVPFCRHLLPGFSIIHIGIDVAYARAFLERGVTEFSLLEAVIMGRKGKKFMAEVRVKGGVLCSWTVNSPETMRWCTANHLDGVVTDEVGLFGDMCKEYLENPEVKGYGKLPWGRRFENAAVRALAWMVSRLWRWTRGGVMWVGDEALKGVEGIGGEVGEVGREGRTLVGQADRR